VIQKFKAASFWTKVGYISLAIGVLLGLGNLSDKALGVIMRVDSRYAKQVALDQTNIEVAELKRNYKVDRMLQLEQQMFDMQMRYGNDMSKWTDAQRQLYFKLKAEYDALKEEVGTKG
jgi:hypothetical protein